MRILAYSSDKVACSWQRLLLPCHWMRKLGLAEVEWGEGEDTRAFDWADLVIFQRWYGGRPYIWFKEMWRRGVRLVYEIDDDVWTMQADNPFRPFYDRETLTAMEDMIRKAHMVTVPCRGLAEAMARWNANVAIIPSGVDPGVFALERARFPGEVRLGFSGSKTHDRDFAPLLEVLPGIMRRHPEVKLTLIGEAPTALKSTLKNFGLLPRVVDVGWVPWEGNDKQPSMYQALAAAGTDIAMVPLNDTPFNVAKSAIKYYENGALRTCVAAADTGIYAETIRDGENGRLVKANRSTQWERVLEELIVDEAQRQRLGEAAREEVRKRYSYDVLAHRWAAAYRSLLPARKETDSADQTGVPAVDWSAPVLDGVQGDIVGSATD